ncbi:MAG: hypothetical protein ACOCUI_03395 [bacterium]
MGLNYYTYLDNQELFDDELIEKALKTLSDRRKKMANWIEENKPLLECPECGSGDISYKYNGAKCNNCGHFKEIEVPYPAKGGVVASRKLTGIFKELFGLRLAKKAKREKPSKDEIRALPFKIGDFETGEFTEAEIRFLNKRFHELIKQNESDNLGADNFLYHIMAQQEIILQRIFRKQILEFGNQKRNTMDKKREFETYNKIIDNLEATKKSRKGDSEESILREIMKEKEEDIGDKGIEELVEEYEKQKEEEKEELEKSKGRRKQVGNNLG